MYDVGEFEGHLDAALKNAGWHDFDKRLAASKKAEKSVASASRPLSRPALLQAPNRRMSS